MLRHTGNQAVTAEEFLRQVFATKRERLEQPRGTASRGGVLLAAAKPTANSIDDRLDRFDKEEGGLAWWEKKFKDRPKNFYFTDSAVYQEQIDEVEAMIQQEGATPLQRRRLREVQRRKKALDDNSLNSKEY